jgi:hypothetical protein
MGQVTHQDNYADLWVYGPTAGGHIWSQRTASETFLWDHCRSQPDTHSGCPVNDGERSAWAGRPAGATVSYGAGCTNQTPTASNITGAQITAGTSFSVASITAGGNMTLSTSANLRVGAFLTSGTIAFAGATIVSGSGTSYVISKTGLTSGAGTGVADARAITGVTMTQDGVECGSAPPVTISGTGPGAAPAAPCLLPPSCSESIFLTTGR